MSTYGDGGTTYGGLFGGGVATYGDFGGTTTPPASSTSTKYRIYELSAVKVREWSKVKVYESTDWKISE